MCFSFGVVGHYNTGIPVVPVPEVSSPAGVGRKGPGPSSRRFAHSIDCSLESLLPEDAVTFGMVTYDRWQIRGTCAAQRPRVRCSVTMKVPRTRKLRPACHT